MLNIPDYTKKNIFEIKNILETTNVDKNNSIIDLMFKMVNFNIPPHLNWLFDNQLEPFVMFIKEFNYSLNQNDLSKIWQNTAPDIMFKPEVVQSSIEYFLGEQELFENLSLNEIENVNCLVFKIKQRAAGNYYDLTAGEEQITTEIPWYSYNWPYDYFSLVELLNIQAGEVYESGSI